MDTSKYPLENLIIIKQNRFDAAVKTLEEKKELLEKAYEKLFIATEARDQVLQHRRAKLEQMKEAFDEGTNTDEIQKMQSYLKVVKERLIEKEKKVTQEQAQVDLAQKQVDLATDELFQRKKDLEKLQMHKKEWQKEADYWTKRKEAGEQDEQGTAGHVLRKKEQKMRNKRKEDE